MIPSQRWPLLHLKEETATAADLYSYLRGVVALKGRTGLFRSSGTDVSIVQGVGRRLMVGVIHKNGGSRVFLVKPDSVRVVTSSDPVLRDTDGFHAWYITSHLRAHLVTCFREREAKAA